VFAYLNVDGLEYTLYLTAIRIRLIFRIGFALNICIKTSRHHIVTILALLYMRVHRVVRLRPLTNHRLRLHQHRRPSRSIWDLTSAAREQ